MAAPTRVSYHVQATTPFLSTGTPKTCTGVTFQVGDRLEVKASAEQHGTSATVTPALSAGVATWTKYADQGAAGANNSGTWSWVGVVTTAASNVTVTLARPTGSNIQWGFTVSVIRGSSGVGVRFEGTNGTASGAPSVTQTVAANSLLTCQINDWNADDGASRTWRTVNGSAITEASYYRSASTHTIYGGYVADSGAGGSVTMGLTAPATQRWVMSGFEFLGTAGSTPNTGAASGAWSFSAASSGKRTPKASTTAGWSFSGAGSGKRNPKASASGAATLAGTASGTRAPKATGSGTYAVTGSASGKAGAGKGTGGGSLAWTAAATGKRTSTATGSGSYAYASSATGNAPAVGQSDGSGSGSWSLAGAATGRRAPKGTGSSAYAYVGNSLGSSPAVDSQTGTGSGAWSLTGQAAGRRSPRATGSGVLTLVAAAAGSQPIDPDYIPPELEVGPVAPPRFTAAAARESTVTATRTGRSLTAGPARPHRYRRQP